MLSKPSLGPSELEEKQENHMLEAKICVRWRKRRRRGGVSWVSKYTERIME